MRANDRLSKIVSAIRSFENVPKFGWAALLLLFFCHNIFGQPILNPSGEQWGTEHSKEELREDLTILKDALYTYHIDLLQYSTEDAAKSTFNSIHTACRDGMSAQEFYLQLSLLNKVIRNVHTSILPPKVIWDKIKFESPVLPLLIYERSDTIYILKSFTGDERIAPGSILKSINGVAANEILSHIQDLFKRDAYNTSYPKRRAYYSFPWLLNRCFGLFDSFDLEIIDPLGELKSLSVESNNELSKLFKEGQDHDQLYLAPYGDWDSPIQLMEGADHHLLRVGTFLMSDYADSDIKYYRYLKKVFKRINKSKNETLILDLRDNSGGQPEPTEALLAYLLPEPFRLCEEVSAKVDHIDEGHPFVENENLVQFNETPWVFKNGVFELDERDWKKYKQPKKHGFRGKLIVLINAFTNSAAATFAGQLKNRPNTVFIGEETGGNPHRTVARQIVTLELPNSKMRVMCPLVRSVKKVKVDQKDRGVIPDIECIPTIQDLLDGRDAGLERAKALY